MEKTSTYEKLAFLKGGGEMGALTHSFSWEETSLGSPYAWPQSLRATLGVVLNSGFPMFLFWGPELICFYNDAFRHSLGENGKHPAVGKRGKEVWAETWDIIGPLIEQVRATGEPVFFNDMLVPFYRNGTVENIYWTFSYSPAYGDSGEIEGIFVTCQETTASLGKQSRLEESESRFRALIKDAPVGITVMRGEDFIMEHVNEAMLRFIGRDSSIIGRRVLDVFPEVESQQVWPLLQDVYQKGEPHTLNGVPVSLIQDGVLKEGFYDVSYTPVKEGGKTVGVLQLVQDVTEKMRQQQALQVSEERFRNLVMKVPFGVSVYRGKELIGETINEMSLALMGRQREEMEGKPLFEAMPQLRERMEPVIAKIMSDGITVQRKEIPTPIVREGAETLAYFNATWMPFRDGDEAVAGVIAAGYDVTEQVLTRQAIRRSEQRFRAAIDAVQGILWTNDPTGKMVGEQAGWAALTGQSPEQYQAYGWTNAVHPEDVQPTIDAWEEAVRKRKIFIHEHRVRRADGTWGYYSIRAIPLLDEDGNVTEWVGVHTDITAQREAQQRTDERWRHLLSSFEQSPAAIALLSGDDDLVFQMANTAYGIIVDRKPEDIVGKPLLEALPEIRGQGFDQLLKGVISSGKAYTANEVAVYLKREGDLEKRYVDLAYQPLRSGAGEVNGILVVATDVTQQVRARQAVEESEAYLRHLTDAVPAIIWITRPDGFCTYLNKSWYDYTGQSKEEAEGFGWLDATHPDDKEEAGRLFVEANTAQQPFMALYRLRDKNGDYRWTMDYGRPKFAPDGAYEGMIGTVVDVHEQKMAEEKIRASERKLRSVFSAAPAAMGLFVGRELVVEMPNQVFIDIVGKGPDIEGKPLREVMPELVTEGQPFLKILDEVFTTGKPYQTDAALVKIMRNGVLTDNYYNITYTPIFNEQGDVYAILDIAIDVTEAVMARQKVEDAEQRLRGVVESAPFPIGIYVGRELNIQFANETIIKIFGKGTDVIGRNYTELLPELEGTGIFEQLRGVIDTGKPFHAKGQRVDLVVGGERKIFYFNYSFTPLYDAAGTVYAVMNTAADVTDVVLAKQQVEEAESKLRGAIELAELATWEVDAVSGAGYCSARLNEWIGVHDGEDQLAAFMDAIHPDEKDRVARQLAAAMQPGSSGHYEAEYCLVQRHSGQERIIHAQGKTRFDADGNPVSISGTAQDITAQRRHQEELERLVAQRTAELAEANAQLQRSNEELTQYAYVASHDLQEPLRKIRVFANMLEGQSELSAQSRELIGKMEAASARMAMLIKDLLEFSRLLNSDALVRPVDLNEICRSVLSDFELSIREKGATVHVSELPRVEAVPLQMNQLFYNMLSNALKFARPGVTPEITISCRPMMPEEVRTFIAVPNTSWLYYDIAVKDNGIGFEPAFAEQIFEVFKRLHNRDAYPGSGIGLALCRRIVANAHGHLYAESTPGEGTSFHIILPDRLTGR